MPEISDQLVKLFQRGELTGKQAIQLKNAYKANRFTSSQFAALSELERRSDFKTQMAQNRKEVFDEMASEIGPFKAFFTGAGKGFATVGRGLHLVDPAGEAEKTGMASLKEARPYTTGAGEIIGEAAPFVPLTVGTGGLGLAARTGISAGVGALEGGILAEGTDKDWKTGAMAGTAFGSLGEVGFSMLGSMGDKLFRKVMDKIPEGALLDATGKPTPELTAALKKAGMSFDDLVGDAMTLVGEAAPGTNMDQLVRKAMFGGEDIPISKGEMTRDFSQQYREQRLLESSAGEAAEPFRQFKLQQSEAIKSRLDDLLQGSPIREETGELIKDALTGRKKLLRTQKNELYKSVAEQTADKGGIPIFTKGLEEALPDARALKRLDRVSKGSIKDGLETLEEYGVIAPTKEGIDIEPLSIENFEEVRQALNMIMRNDQSGASKVAFKPVIDALDSELDEMVEVLGKEGLPANVLGTLKEARKTVRRLKTEYSPQSLVGRLVDTKKDGVTDIIEASKIYDKVSGRATPIEDIRKMMSSLGKSGDKGKEALGSIQTTTVMDLLDAGFGTQSRKISGQIVFNPIAFKKRIKTLGQDKLKVIFANNPEALMRINNIDRIAKELVPENLAVPKGSSSSLLDIATRLLGTKIPGGNMALSVMKSVADPITTDAAGRKAIKDVTPGVLDMRNLLEKQFPGIATALGIAATTGMEEAENE